MAFRSFVLHRMQNLLQKYFYNQEGIRRLSAECYVSQASLQHRLYHYTNANITAGDPGTEGETCGRRPRIVIARIG
jgi:hypothetical protein